MVFQVVYEIASIKIKVAITENMQMIKTDSTDSHDLCYFSSLNNFYSTSNSVPNTVFYFRFLNLFTFYSTSDSSFWIFLVPLPLLLKPLLSLPIPLAKSSYSMTLSK